MKKQVFTIPEAIKYQKEACGRSIFSRDALYALARSEAVTVIKVGNRIYFPQHVIDGLLDGSIHARSA